MDRKLFVGFAALLWIAGCSGSSAPEMKSAAKIRSSAHRKLPEDEPSIDPSAAMTEGPATGTPDKSEPPEPSEPKPNEEPPVTIRTVPPDTPPGTEPEGIPPTPPKEKVRLPGKGIAPGTKIKEPPSPAADEEFVRIRILYATDRQRTGDDPNEFYGSERGPGTGLTPFECGQCEVSIPLTHEVGEVERPSYWKFEFRENPARHVVLHEVRPLAGRAFVDQLQAELRQSRDRAALLFVHGFNVEFADAARRTAQMKFDLGFDGAALMYSWPAPKNYVECEGNVAWTRPHLIEFLTQYLRESGAARIHLIAHSMGTRVLCDALQDLIRSEGRQAPRYNQIVLAAPDIDAEVFRQQIAPRIVGAAERVSIYASSKDLALVASKKVHHYARLGEGGARLTVFPGLPRIEVVDASGIDESLLGHSYYGDSPILLRDLRFVLTGSPQSQRSLRPRGDYFQLVPP